MTPTAARAWTGDRRWAILWFALILASSLVTFDPKLYINGDNVEYINLAAQARSGDLWASPKYPPLFPILLILPQSIFGLALLPQKILVALLYAACAALLIMRSRRIFPVGWGEPIAWIAMTLIPVLEYGHYVMSEIPYLFFALIALEAWDRLPRRDLWTLLAAAAAAATFYTRSVGLSLWVALGISAALGARPAGRRLWVFAGASMAFFAPWLVRSLAGPANPYFRQLVQVNPFHPEWGILGFSGWLARIGENIRVYLAGEIPTDLLPVLFRWTYDPPELRYRFLPFAIGLVVLILLAIGLWRILRRREATGIYLLLYLAICLVWPSIWTGIRFLVPILPLLALAMFEGLLWILGVVRSRFPRRRSVAVALLLAWIALGFRNQSRMAGEVRSYPPDWDAYFRAAAWIGENAAPEELTVDRKPALLSYASGRRAITFPREEDPARMLRWMEERSIDYVLVAPIPYDDIIRYLIPAVQARQDRFEPVFEIEEPYTVVLRLTR